jgi:dual specificity MAP kinase phosphatase
VQASFLRVVGAVDAGMFEIMATIALPRPIPSEHHRPSSPNPITSTLSLDNINASAACPMPIPNKHLPVCPPGPIPAQPDTPPQSPPSDELSLTPPSLLYPPNKYEPRLLGAFTIYKIDAEGVAAALDHAARQPLPDPSLVFPWLHGLHPCNQIQQAFFVARRKNLRKPPKCLRGITIVKAGGDLSRCRLKGAISPDEFLLQEDTGAVFLEVDPKEGFSVRNFQIQAAKFAMLSDIVVYGDDDIEVQKLSNDVAAAQQIWRDSHEEKGIMLPQFNTFICTSLFSEFERTYPDIVSTDSEGKMTGKVMDFFHQERVEMCSMTRASEIDHNIWVGPTPDPAIDLTLSGINEHFDILIECSDLGRLNPLALQAIAEGTDDDLRSPKYLEFPSSGSIMPPTWSHAEADGILETCRWLYNLSHGELHPANWQDLDAEGDSPMPNVSRSPLKIREKKILIHCTDGYTESTLLAISYFTYATGLPVPTAWLDLHVSKGRNFFAYPSDVALLTSVAPRLLSESPVHRNKSLSDITELVKDEPEWIKNIDGSLPSRIVDYMYLGNLGHANNPDLLRRMGICQILSVGETAIWGDGEILSWGEDNVLAIRRVQDNGVDPLADDFERCLEFIGTSSFLFFPVLFYSLSGLKDTNNLKIEERPEEQPP